MDINTATTVTDGNNEFSTEDIFFQSFVWKLVTYRGMSQQRAEEFAKSVVLTLMDSVSFAKRFEENAKRKE